MKLENTNIFENVDELELYIEKDLESKEYYLSIHDKKSMGYVDTGEAQVVCINLNNIDLIFKAITIMKIRLFKDFGKDYKDKICFMSKYQESINNYHSHVKALGHAYDKYTSNISKSAEELRTWLKLYDKGFSEVIEAKNQYEKNMRYKERD